MAIKNVNSVTLIKIKNIESKKNKRKNKYCTLCKNAVHH